jgi:hypothetical protein
MSDESDPQIVSPDKPPFPFAGVSCLLMGGLLMYSGGMRLGPYLIGFAILWAAIAIFLRMKQP